MQIEGVALKQTVTIRRLCSVHYFEFSPNYTFPGESHDFWELVYVDKGEVIITAEDKEFSLYRGEAIFHRPNEWHNIRSNGAVAPNVMIVSFECHSPAMDRLVGNRYFINEMEKQFLSGILSESRCAFASPLNDPYDNTLTAAENEPTGAQQMICMNLSMLLISLIRRPESTAPAEQKIGTNSRLEEIREYMLLHLSEKITLKRLADEFHVSQSYLKKLFSEYANCGAIHYFLRLRTARAKELLRSSEQNVSQIAETLGYENIYYFSSQFHRFTGMSPVEYRRSVKALDEKGRKLRGL